MIQPLTLQDELNAIAHGDNNDLGGRGMSGNDEVITNDGNVDDLFSETLLPDDDTNSASLDRGGTDAPAPSPPPTHPDAQRFAERFRYPIISSGLLEKDFITDKETAGQSSRSWWDKRRDVWIQVKGAVRETWAESSGVRERWDILLAGIVAVASSGVVLGWKRLGMLVLGALFGAIYYAVKRQVSQRKLSTRDRALGAITTLLSTSASLDRSLSRTLHRLDTDNGTTELRSTLHRLCDTLTDDLAATSSSLGELVNKDELKLLAEMHDIPLTRRKVDSNSWQPSASIPSPRRPTSLHISPPSTIRPSRSRLFQEPTSAWAMTVSRSLPPTNTTPASRGHSHHLSLLPSLHTDGVDDSDRFTSVPRRTPRISKRASWDPVAWDRHRDVDALGLGSPLERKDRRRRESLARHERRITEKDEDEVDVNGLKRLSLPASPSRAHTPSRSSPLTGRVNGIRPSLTESAIQLATLAHSPQPRSKRKSLQQPLHVPMSANPKRRSLQNLTYNPSDHDGLQRIRSNTSDLPTRADRRLSMHSHASHASAGSIHSIGSLQSLRSSLLSPPRSAVASRHSSPPQRPFPSVARVASLSPFTSPALQAACLGVHLRRRRVACELLALRWDGDDDYWREIITIIEMLDGRIKQGVEVLEREMSRLALSQLSASTEHRPVWAMPRSLDTTDWAPRSTNEDRLMERIGSLQRELETAWRCAEDAKRAIHTDAGDLQSAWISLKASVSLVVRDVERGREVIRDMSPTGPASSEEEVPDFVQSWDDTTARSTSVGTTSSAAETRLVHSSPQENEAESTPNIEMLPMVGKDEVYEAHITGVLDGRAELGRMSREERIALTRKAREQGKSVVELLRTSEVAMDANKAVGVEARLARSGVVHELQGLMGMIRRKKGETEGGISCDRRDREVDAPIDVPCSTFSQRETTSSGNQSSLGPADWRSELMGALPRAGDAVFGLVGGDKGEEEG